MFKEKAAAMFKEEVSKKTFYSVTFLPIDVLSNNMISSLRYLSLFALEAFYNMCPTLYIKMVHQFVFRALKCSQENKDKGF